jgi:hypothetical protein
MKYFLGVFCLLLMISCDSMNRSEEPNYPLKGTWKLTGYYLVDSETGDTILTEDRQQYKMFSEKHVVWTNSMLGDSLDLYGMGTYRMESDTLYEEIFTSALPVREFFSENPSFVIPIDYADSTFTQVISDSTEIRVVETYVRIE